MARLMDIEVPEGLIASARDGVECARARLYETLAPATFGLICRLVGARTAAEDVFQDTMMTMFEQLAGFRGDGPFGAWVRRIAVTRSLMYLRSPWHRARIGLSAEEPSEDRADASAVMPPFAVVPAFAAECLDVERALASLPPVARAIVWLYEVEGYSHQEIARAFGRTVSFSKSQLARAHRRLREWYEPKGARQPCTTLTP